MKKLGIQQLLLFGLGFLFCGVIVLAAWPLFNTNNSTGHPKKLDGVQKISGTVYAEKACTLMGCPVENQCCNSCGGNIYIAETVDSMDRVYVAKGIDDFYTCAGTECEVSCDSPFVEGMEYEVTGPIKMESDQLPLNSKYIIADKITEL